MKYSTKLLLGEKIYRLFYLGEEHEQLKDEDVHRLSIALRHPDT
jgi:hypothetical protein